MWPVSKRYEHGIPLIMAKQSTQLMRQSGSRTMRKPVPNVATTPTPSAFCGQADGVGPISGERKSAFALVVGALPSLLNEQNRPTMCSSWSPTRIRALLQRRAHDRELPVFVFDAGYDATQLAHLLGELPIAVLVRLRSNCCISAEPTEKRSGGRLRRHGAKFVFRNPQTWGDPTCIYVADDGESGHVLVQAWPHMHAKSEQHQTRGTYQPRPVIPGGLVRSPSAPCPNRLVRRSQSGSGGMVRNCQTRERVWKAYRVRFQLEHCSSCANIPSIGRLLACDIPNKRIAGQSWFCWRTRCCVLLVPWLSTSVYASERPLKDEKLTSSRVRRSLSALLPHLPSWVDPPKACGKSPGRPKEQIPVQLDVILLSKRYVSPLFWLSARHRQHASASLGVSSWLKRKLRASC